MIIETKTIETTQDIAITDKIEMIDIIMVITTMTDTTITMVIEDLIIEMATNKIIEIIMDIIMVVTIIDIIITTIEMVIDLLMKKELIRTLRI